MEAQAYLVGVASLKLWTKGQYLLEKEQNQGNIDLRHPGTDTPVSGGEGGGVKEVM